MIDTIKIYTYVKNDIFNVVRYNSNIKTMYKIADKMIFYEIITDSLEGSYDSRMSVRVLECPAKSCYILQVECSYHKIVKGHNCFDGFYNLEEIVNGIIEMLSNKYSFSLPSVENWYLKRIDITKVFDLRTNEEVEKYINLFNTLSYPRRAKSYFIPNESVYFPGTTTTLKIYNKLKEFIKHDKKKFLNFDFDLDTFMNKISGYVRFECEIKYKKIKDFYKKNEIKIVDVKYEDLEKIWSDEFMKILKFRKEEKEIVRTKDDVLKRLQNCYKDTKAMNLYSFFLAVKEEGYQKIRKINSKSTFYRKVKELQDVGIDFSQSFTLQKVEENYIDFNPFLNVEKEVV